MNESIRPLRVGIVDAARVLGISRAQVYKHITAGILRPQKDGKRAFVSIAELERFVAERDQAPT